MTTFRIQKRLESYTKIANEAIQDSRLSLKARGLHHLLLSYSDNWIVNIKHLTKQCDRDGRDAIYSAIKELKELGYIVQSRGRDDLGRLAEAKYDVYELPSDAPNPEKTEQVSPNPDYPDTANPDTANPDTANPDAYKEINSNKDLIEEINKEHKNSGARKSKSQSRKKPKTFDYNSLPESKAFSDFWGWYRRLANETDSSPGDKQSAGNAWEEALTLGSLEDIRKGAAIFAKNVKRQQSKIPHASRFLAGAPRNQHPTPYWQSALDSLAPIEGKDFAQLEQEKAVIDDLALARLAAARRAEGIAS